MPILTPRLLIRPRERGDGATIARAIAESHSELRPWLPWAKDVPTPEAAEENCVKAIARFALREDLTLTVYSRDGREFIGSTGFHRINWNVRAFEVGYWIRTAHAGRGFISESTNALTRYAFSVLNARRLELRCDPKNAKSLRVIDRLGFMREGILKNSDLNTDGEIRDTVIAARYDAANLPALDVTW